MAIFLQKRQKVTILFMLVKVNGLFWRIFHSAMIVLLSEIYYFNFGIVKGDVRILNAELCGAGFGWESSGHLFSWISWHFAERK